MRTMLSRLSRPPDGPTIIAADSTEEALGFLAELFGERGGDDLAIYRDRVLVFDKTGVLPRLAEGAQSFIPVVITREVERELAPFVKTMHSIVIYPRNAASTEPHIVLEPANYEIFKKALEGMGKGPDEIKRLEMESGRSLTVLRRRLATVPAVQMPHWAADHTTAISLVPFLFVGAWQSTNEADRVGLSLLAGDRQYDELEKTVQSLAQLNDAPVWSIGSYRGVISKIDLLHSIARVVTADDLKRYFSMARIVLGEDDPALDLDEDKRWMAPILGKKREFSGAFREGISETLVLLAVHGGNLFKNRLGIDPEVEALFVVRDLLPKQLTTRILEANDRDLPTYAEAAPDEFLSILESDLKAESPATRGLLRPAVNAVLGHGPSGTGLLWALEGLSWSPQTFPRAVLILAHLAQFEINDNWANKPTHSLQSIFRAWMPQTAASYEDRVGIMRKLEKRFPDIAWKICVSQFGQDHHEVGNYCHKPRWRPDGFGFGEPLPWEPILAFRREMVEMALSWREYSFGMLVDLVERLHDLSENYQARVWVLIEKWAKTIATDPDKAAMREKVRIVVLSRRAAIRTKKTPRVAALIRTAKAAFVALEPSDLMNKHAWLFREAWVEESADEVEDIEDLNFQKRDERIKRMRVDAIREIRDQKGLPALLELAARGNASWQLGVHAAHDLLPEAELVELLRLALKSVHSAKDSVYPLKNVIAGALFAITNEVKRLEVLKAVAEGLSDVDTVQLLLLAPFGKATWNLIDALGETAQSTYWANVVPNWFRDSDAENNEGVERLLKGHRPRAAFFCVRFHPEKLDALVLYRLLKAMATASGDTEKPEEYRPDQSEVEHAFRHLNASSALTLDQKAWLEFAFLEVLARSWDDRQDSYGIPNLERHIEAHPELFVQAITWAYKRNDGGTDPADVQVPPDHVQTMATRGHRLLEAIRRIPAHNELGELKVSRLSNWILAVQQASAALGRAEIANVCIGVVLANAPIGQDGVWPCEPVRDVMEELQSTSMMQGAHTGVFNSRGVQWRGEGGNQERDLAKKYRKWGQALQLSHPFVSSKLLFVLSQTYENEANFEDTKAGVRRRRVSFSGL